MLRAVRGLTMGPILAARRSAVDALNSADPCVAAGHVFGRLLHLSHISLRTCVAALLSDHRLIGGLASVG
jgi:hypothetical protein